MRVACAALALAALVIACSEDAGTGASNPGTTSGMAAGGRGGSGGSSSHGGAATTSTTGGAEGGQGGVSGRFELTIQTLLSNGTIVLRTNLPLDPAACDAAGAGALCADADGDGLVDRWEDIAIDRLRPFAVLDEDESIIDDPQGITGIVARVAPAGAVIHQFMMLGYSKDYGSCGFTGHNGDSERVALELDPLPSDGPGSVRVTAFYTAAHEGTSNDHGHVYRQDEFARLVFTTDSTYGEPRWTVYPSQDKHATYASIDICENVSSIPCVEEDCAPDGVANPEDFMLLMPYVNAGEEAAPFVTDLTSMGFAGDDAWAMQDFCGGLGGTSCSSPVRDKLLVSPF